MFSKILMVGANHRFASLLLLVLITVAACFGLPKLTIDTGLNSLISDTDPDKAVYERVSTEFGSDNRSIIYIKDENLWSPEKLAALEELHYKLEGLEFVERVDDLFNLRSIRGKNGEVDSRIFLPEAPKNQNVINEAKLDALYNPLIVGNFLSPDATVTAIMVSIKEDRSDDGFDRRVNDIFEEVIAPSRSVFQDIFQVGSPRINAELKSILFDDLTFLAPLSALALVLAILFFLRSGTAAIIPLVTSALTLTWTFGMMAWFGIPLNLLSAMLPSLIIVIGSTEDTHMISSYFHGLEESAENKRDHATRFMMKHMSVPLILTILTTSMGFGSNIFSSIGLIQDFAIASTFAMLANGFITILFVPLVLSIMGPLKSNLFHDKAKNLSLPGLFVRAFGYTNSHFPRIVLVVTGLLCCFFLYKASNLHVTNDPLTYFQQDRPIIQQTHKIHRDLSGMKVFFITLEAEDEKAFQEPKNIEKLVRIQEFLEQQNVFDRSISLADHLSLVNREFNGGQERFFTVPQRRELIAQYLLFFHHRDLESYISHDMKRANIVVRHNISDSKTLNANIRELKEVVANIAGNDMKSFVVGENLMVNAAAESLLSAQIMSLLILLLVIFITMSAMFTSIKGGLISLIPNLMPIIMMFGVMGILGIPLNPGTAMVAVIAIGIAIDGTIHLFSRYNDLCRRTSNYEEAVQITVEDEATPMVATSLSLALGFGILLFSNFTLIAQFGALSAATMLFALFSNLLVTPIIMSRIRLVGLYQILVMQMRKEVFEQSPLFDDMTDYQMCKAVLISELHEFKPNDLLVEQGTVGRSMYMILSGKVEVTLETEHASKQLATLDAGQVFGEIGYIKETKRTANVRALTEVSALRFDYERLKKDLKFFPHIVAKLNFNISRILGERLASVVNSLAPEERTKDIEAKIERDKISKEVVGDGEL